MKNHLDSHLLLPVLLMICGVSNAIAQDSYVSVELGFTAANVVLREEPQGFPLAFIGVGASHGVARYEILAQTGGAGSNGTAKKVRYYDYQAMTTIRTNEGPLFFGLGAGAGWRRIRVWQRIDSFQAVSDRRSLLAAFGAELSIEGPPVGFTFQYRRILSALEPDWMFLGSMRLLIKWDWLF